MELQLQRCGKWSHDALHVLFRQPWRHIGERGYRIRPRAHNADESLRLSLIDTEGGNGINTKVSPADRWKEVPRNFVATPRYSSLLKLTRRRRHEVRMETRDRVMLSLSDWVSRRVQDPLVEIDPVTVNEAIQVEQESAEPTVATSTSPSLFGYLPPGFPRRGDRAAIAALIVLLLAALGTAVILALLRGRKKAGSVTHLAPEGPEGNGSVTNGGARQDLEDDREVTWQESSVESDQAVRKQPVPVVTTSLENQATTYRPIPQYSTAMDQSDLPLPPSFGGSTKDKQIDPPSSSSDEDLVVPFATLPSDEQAETADHGPPPPVEEASETIGEETGSSNGVVKGDGLLEEELLPEASGRYAEELVELISAEDSPSADESVAVGAGGLPSASESLEIELSDIAVGEEYILIGKADKLSPVSAFSAPHTKKSTETLPPATAGVGVPVDSILVEESAARLPSEKSALSASAQEAVPVGSVPSLEELQAGSGADVADERRREYTQVIEKVLPAVSVGAGVAALSSFSGVDGALQVVGALAAASFLREVFWAGPRQQLFDEIRNIKSHDQLLQFLEEKKIFPQSWSH